MPTGAHDLDHSVVQQKVTRDCAKKTAYIAEGYLNLGSKNENRANVAAIHESHHCQTCLCWDIGKVENIPPGFSKQYPSLLIVYALVLTTSTFGNMRQLHITVSGQ